MLDIKSLQINIVTYFKDLHLNYFNHSFFKQLIEEKKLKINIYSLIEFSKLTNKRVDDSLFGGGNGMLMRFDFLYDFLEFKKVNLDFVIHPSPCGEVLNQDLVRKLCITDNITFICSRYEGIDKRAIEHFNMQEVSIGDYVLYDGDTACMVIVNCIVRNIFVKIEAKINESFSSGNYYLLEADSYTRPRKFLEKEVPNVLLCGNHNDIRTWRLKNSLQKTKNQRPDLIKKNLNDEKNKNT